MYNNLREVNFFITVIVCDCNRAYHYHISERGSRKYFEKIFSLLKRSLFSRYFQKDLNRIFFLKKLYSVKKTILIWKGINRSKSFLNLIFYICTHLFVLSLLSQRGLQRIFNRVHYLKIGCVETVLKLF